MSKLMSAALADLLSFPSCLLSLKQSSLVSGVKTYKLLMKMTIDLNHLVVCAKHELSIHKLNINTFLKIDRCHPCSLLIFHVDERQPIKTDQAELYVVV